MVGILTLKMMVINEQKLLPYILVFFKKNYFWLGMNKHEKLKSRR